MNASQLYEDLHGKHTNWLNRLSVIDFAEKYYLAKKAETLLSPSQSPNDSYFVENRKCQNNNFSVHLGTSDNGY